MDSLVSQYSRPAYADEGQTSDEQLELHSGTPELSLKFALPPVAQVRLAQVSPHRRSMLTPAACSPHHGFVQ